MDEPKFYVNFKNEEQIQQSFCFGGSKTFWIIQQAGNYIDSARTEQSQDLPQKLIVFWMNEKGMVDGIGMGEAKEKPVFSPKTNVHHF